MHKEVTMGRRKILTVDPLEGRELLSLTPLLGLLGSPHVSTLASTGGTTGSGSNTGSGGTITGGPGTNGGSIPITVNPVTGIPENLNNGGNGVTLDASLPRPNEVARRAFRASFSGRVIELPPRLVDQSRQFFILAPGYTNQFIHGTLELRYYTPAPGSGVRVVTGSLSIADRSTQSGGVILADLSGDPTQVDARGRPTLLNLTLNGGGGSGGIYASSSGGGTVNITYHGNRATIKVAASIFILGIGSPLSIFQTNTHH